jgi:hypothetical protein
MKASIKAICEKLFIWLVSGLEAFIGMLYLATNLGLVVFGIPLTAILTRFSSREATFERLRRYQQTEGIGRMGVERHYGCVTLLAAGLLCAAFAVVYYSFFD